MKRAGNAGDVCEDICGHDLQDWNRFWGLTDTGSTQGLIRYQGGYLHATARANAEQLTPEDFRLGPDSAGYRAGPDGKDLGADMAFAWPTAEIAVMGAAGAANIIHRKEIKEAADPAAKREEKIEAYEELFSNPYRAANRGYIDAVIVPSQTRPRLIDALEIMCTKRELRPAKEHGNIPM